MNEGRALVTDLKEWVELKVTHTQLQLQTRVERALAVLVVRSATAGLATAAALFLLVAVALGLGRWTGFPSAGFALVGLFLAGTAVGVWLGRHRLSAREPTAEVTVGSLDAAPAYRALGEKPSASGPDGSAPGGQSSNERFLAPREAGT